MSEERRKKDQSRWQKLNVVFPPDFPSTREFLLFSDPGIREDVLPRNWDRNFELSPKKSAELVNFAWMEMDWNPKDGKVETALRRIRKKKVKREKIKEQEELAEEKRLRELRNNSPKVRVLGMTCTCPPPP